MFRGLVYSVHQLVSMLISTKYKFQESFNRAASFVIACSITCSEIGKWAASGGVNWMCCQLARMLLESQVIHALKRWLHKCAVLCAQSHTACTAASISFMLSDIFVGKLKSRCQTRKHLIVFPTMIKSIAELTPCGRQHWRPWPGWRDTGAPQTGNNVSCQFGPKSPRSRYIRRVTLTFLQSPPPTQSYYSPLFLTYEGQTWCKKITFSFRRWWIKQRFYSRSEVLLSSLSNIFSLKYFLHWTLS